MLKASRTILAVILCRHFQPSREKQKSIMKLKKRHILKDSYQKYQDIQLYVLYYIFPINSMVLNHTVNCFICFIMSKILTSDFTSCVLLIVEGSTVTF